MVRGVAEPTSNSLTTALMTISETQPEVLSTPERRRRWSVDQKLGMVAEMMRPGSTARLVARRHGISTGLLYTWRRQAMKGELAPAAAPAFVPVKIAEKEVVPEACKPSRGDAGTWEGLMVIELPGDRRIHVDRHVDGVALSRVIAALAGR
jgi:transposase